MRKIVIVKKVYTYNELNEEAKSKVKEWYLEGQESDFYEEMILEKLKEIFPNSDLKVQYNLNNCQGDGVNVYGTLKFEDLIPHTENFLFSEKELSTLKTYFNILKLNEYVDSFSLPVNPKYSYCMVDYIAFKNNLIYLLKNYIDESNINKRLLHKFSVFIKTFITNLCEEFEKDGYNYFYEISEDDLKEVCDSNDYEFYEDGTLY